MGDRLPRFLFFSLLVLSGPVLAQGCLPGACGISPPGTPVPPGAILFSNTSAGVVFFFPAKPGAAALPSGFEDAIPKSFDEPRRDIQRKPVVPGGLSLAVQSGGISLPPGVQEQQQGCGGDSPRDSGAGGCLGGANSASTTEAQVGTNATSNRIGVGSESVFAGSPDIRIEDAGIQTPKGLRVD